jgi:hypothetical protein
MKILHIIKEHTEEGLADTVIKDQEGLGNEVNVVRLWKPDSLVADGEDLNYDKLVEQIFSSDQVYSW